MSKILLIVFLISISSTLGFTQSLPDFLPGTWKVENKETYEHWNKINDNSYKGLSYQIKEGKMLVTEYLEINRAENEIIYTATVLDQNQGIGIDFKLNQTDSIYSFENPNHDFPKYIRYQKLTENSMKASVGTTDNHFTLIFKKVK